jgi:hypothetical protein
LNFLASHLGGAREALYGAPEEAGNDCLRPQLQDGTANIPHEPVVFWIQGFTFTEIKQDFFSFLCTSFNTVSSAVHCVGGCWDRTQGARIELQDAGIEPNMLGSNPKDAGTEPKDAGIKPEMLGLNPRYRDRTQDAGIEPMMLGSNPNDGGIEPKGCWDRTQDAGIEPKECWDQTQGCWDQTPDAGIEPKMLGLNPRCWY